MDKKLAAAIVAVTAVVTWEVRDRIAQKQVKNLVRKTDTLDGFSKVFMQGWWAAQEHYTRYYNDDQYKLVFGIDRKK